MLSKNLLMLGGICVLVTGAFFVLTNSDLPGVEPFNGLNSMIPDELVASNEATAEELPTKLQRIPLKSETSILSGSDQGGLSPEVQEQMQLEWRLAKGELPFDHELVQSAITKQVAGNLEHAKDAWAAALCGYTDMGAVQMALESRDSDSVLLAGALRSLVDESVAIASELPDYINLSRQRVDRLERWDIREPHDSDVWTTENLGELGSRLCSVRQPIPGSVH